MNASDVLFNLPVFLTTIHFFYFSIFTLAIKKDPRRLPYYEKLTEEEKKQLDVPRLIRIDSILYLCLALLSVSIYSFNAFTTMHGLLPINGVLLGLTILFASILISKIPLILSKKNRKSSQ